MTQITLTEALAELKLVKEKIAKKSSFVLNYIGRQEGAKDPLEKSGGSQKAINEEMQACGDLQERIVVIRSAIARANMDSKVTINGKERSIADWLVWRRDVAPLVKLFQDQIANGIGQLRGRAKQQSFEVRKLGDTASNPTDVLIELDEKKLAEDSEKLQEILNVLDGKLSLHNATVMVDV